jgi:hypothetical protein
VGHVHIYDLDGQDINGEAAGDGSGLSVAMSVDGSQVAIGAILIGNGFSMVKVHIYDLMCMTWTQFGQQAITGDAHYKYYGHSVAIPSSQPRAEPIVWSSPS